MMSPSAWSLLSPDFEAAPSRLRHDVVAQRPRRRAVRGDLGGRYGTVADAPVTIRRAGDADRPALADLAALDGARDLAGDVLIAEIGDQPVAAIELATERVVADPFSRSVAAAGLLRLRARQLRAADGGGARSRHPRLRGLARAVGVGR